MRALGFPRTFSFCSGAKKFKCELDSFSGKVSKLAGVKCACKMIKERMLLYGGFGGVSIKDSHSQGLRTNCVVDKAWRIKTAR